ncbi:MAG: alpha-1,2-fucosyltransferase [Flavobacteriales bacterium]|nr:alpha-1,2-fucosyltransferase [Flavobacteriales bacterium]
MIIIRLKGGMGNQMFQYAFAKGIAAKLNTEFKTDCSLLLDRSRGKQHIYRNYDLSLFKVQENFTLALSFLSLIYKLKSSFIRKTITGLVAKGKRMEKEKQFHTDTTLLASPSDNAVYDGWWQSAQYFEDVKEELKEDFCFKSPLLRESLRIHQKITETNSICLNVRRTDFLTNPTLNATNLKYFLNAAKKMAEMVNDPHFFVFSDDMKWCEENLIFDFPTEFVQHNLKGEKFGNYLQLMIACKHFIIPNSSFAWWAVWLNENEDKKVIAPKSWFNEGEYDTSALVPETWIRL